jgi:hypothetical protein
MDPSISTQRNPLSQPIVQQSPSQQSPIQQSPISQRPVNKIISSRDNSKLMLLIMIILIIVFGVGTCCLGIGQDKRIEQNKQKKIIPTDIQSSKILGKISSSDYSHNFIFSLDGKRVAYVVGGEGRGTSNYVVIDEKKSKVYSGELYGNVSNLQFSPNGKHFAYWVEEVDSWNAELKSYPSKKYFVLDGQELDKDKEADPHSMIFSPDSQHYSYKIKKGNESWIIMDGTAQGPYEEILDNIFSPDSQRYAYPAKKEGKWFIVYDGKKQKEYYKVYHQTFSPNSQRFAYDADDTGSEKEKLFLVLDNKEYKNFEYAGDLVFSPDSQHIASYGIDNGKQIEIVDDKPYSSYPPDLLSSPPVFSLDGKSLAFVTKDGERFAMVINGKKEESYDLAGGFSFSLDGQHYAYVAAEGKVKFGGGVLPPEEIMYDKMFIVFDGKRDKDYKYDRAPVFSPDSKHLAYRAIEKSGWTMVLDHKEGKTYDSVGTPIFSRDSQNFAYTASLGVDKFLLIINGKESKIYDQIYTVPKFISNDNSWEYGVKLGNELWWIVDKLN